MANRQLSETLKRLRKSKGLSQEKASKALGIPKSTLGSWEYGQSEPNAVMLMRLFHFYGVRDVYSVFEMSAPEAEPEGLNEKYNQLNEENRLIINALIKKLFALQKML